jgi:DNA polymerase-3 subunit gamma/tau
VTYQALYRRYRPRRFAELKGQEHIVRALRNAVREDRVGHAYLFSGPRGTGKTTSARILAKVLNCEQPIDGEPCCACASCLAVESGTSYDVIELDAASNNGVDDVRALIERASLGTAGRRKVYILDEVHMLSRPAEAALLKTLEEPPPHVVFVLATTDPQKVSETIRSRTQHLQFHLLPGDELEQHVRWVIADAGLTVTDDAVDAVVRQGGGSARDTLSALEQVVAAGGIAPEAEPLDDLVDAIAARDTGASLVALARAVDSGRDARTLGEALVAHLRDVLLVQLAPELVRLPDRARERVLAQARSLGLAATTRALEILGAVLVEVRHAPDPRVLVDVALVRITAEDADTTPPALIARLERLERAMAAGGPPAAPAAPTPLRPAVASAPGDDAPAPPAPSSADRSGPRAVLGSRSRSAAPAPRPTPTGASAATPATPAAPEPAPEPVAARPAPSPGTGVAVSRERVGATWSEQVLPSLKPVERALFADATISNSGDGAITLAVPAGVLARCQQSHDAVEAALRRALGAGLTLQIVAGPGGDRIVSSRGPARRDEPPPPDDEVFDPAELVDAPASQLRRSGVDRLLEAFPGAELIDDGGPR